MSGQTNCPIWDIPVQSSLFGDVWEFVSDRAGGSYRITKETIGHLSDFKNKDRTFASKLTTWIVNQHRFGDNAPVIDVRVIRQVDSQGSLQFSEQMNRFFLLLSKKGFRVGNSLQLDDIKDVSHRSDATDLCAWLELSEPRELNDFMRLLINEKLIEHHDADFLLTAEGFRRLEEIQRSPANTRQAFVAMWFDPSMHEVFDQGFKPGIEDAGYSVMRIDKKEHANKIDDEIIAEIRRSKFLVADFTCERIKSGDKEQAISRGGVYFEAGFALGIRVPVIWCCKQDCMPYAHFDTRQFAHIVWTTPEDLRKSLTTRISAIFDPAS